MVGTHLPPSHGFIKRERVFIAVMVVGDGKVRSLNPNLCPHLGKEMDGVRVLAPFFAWVRGQKVRFKPNLPPHTHTNCQRNSLSFSRR